MSPGISRIVILGYGNVGSHLVTWLIRAGIMPVQVFGRSDADLPEGIAFTSDLNEVVPNADLYVLALPDDEIPRVLINLVPREGLYVHCSASLGLDVFPPSYRRTGVFYPLQTFTKGIAMDYGDIPLFLEAGHDEDIEFLRELASRLSSSVSLSTPAMRLTLHVAAVIACNFTNHLLRLGDDFLKAEGLDFSILKPLVHQTFSKALNSSPEQSQTGPARRGDLGTIERHLNRLKDSPELQTIYKLLSDSIISKNN